MVWHVPVRDDLLTGKYTMHINAKIHCFENNVSLCKRYFEITDLFDRPDYGEEDIDTYPEYFCKACVRKYNKLKMYMKEVGE